MAFISNTKATLQEKQSKIWRHIHSLMDMAGLPQNSCLDLALKILNQLPTIPLDLSYHTPIPMMIAYMPESYAYETWCGDGQGTPTLGEEVKASHLLTKKLAQMVVGKNRRSTPMPGLLHHPLQLVQWCLVLQNVHPSDLPIHLGALASCATEASPNLTPPPVTLQSHPKSHHIWALNQRVRMTMKQTLKQAQTQAATQAMTRMKAPLAGTLSMGTQIVSLTARPGSPAVSLKGQAAVQAAVLTAPAPNQKMRRRNLHQWVQHPQMLMQTLLRLACCQRSKALTQSRMRCRAFACLMDEGFSMWWDQKIKDGLEQWSKWDMMTCDHADPSKKAKSPDPLGTPIEYMESCGIFQPMKTSEFELCHFYQMEESGDFPNFLKHHESATSQDVHSLLEKARKKGCPNLVVALSQDAVTAVALLKKLHTSASLWCLKMETLTEAAGKPMWKVSFCPFCKYCGSNNPSHLNHIICAHYKASFGCGCYLGKVYSTGQALNEHMQGCKGLKTDVTKRKSSPSPAKGMSKSSGFKKRHHHHKKLQQSSQMSSHSTPHHSEQTKKKKTSSTSPKKPHSHSSGKDLGPNTQATDATKRMTCQTKRKCTSIQSRRSNVAPHHMCFMLTSNFCTS